VLGTLCNKKRRCENAKKRRKSVFIANYKNNSKMRKMMKKKNPKSSFKPLLPISIYRSLKKVASILQRNS
jgi:hypothetical protein